MVVSFFLGSPQKRGRPFFFFFWSLFFFFVSPWRQGMSRRERQCLFLVVWRVGSMHGPHACSLLPWASQWGAWRFCSPQHWHSECTFHGTLPHLLHLTAHPSFFPLEPPHSAIQNGHSDTVSPPGQVPWR